jgi:hypothetical protein
MNTTTLWLVMVVSYFFHFLIRVERKKNNKINNYIVMPNFRLNKLINVIPKEVADISQIFFQDTQILLKLLSYEKYSGRNSL